MLAFPSGRYLGMSRTPNHVAIPKTSSRARNTEWVRRISRLRKHLNLSQSDLAARINYSDMMLSRWQSGSHEPTSQAYIRMGNLAEGAEATWFWTMAGMKSSDLAAPPEGKSSLEEKTDVPNVRLILGGSREKRSLPTSVTKLVMLPVLDLRVGTDDGKGDNVLDLKGASVSEMIAAPESWCPNPAATNCLRVRGEAMLPMLNNDDIVVVDCTEHGPADLKEQLIVAWHQEFGLRLFRHLVLDGVRALQAETHSHELISIAKNRSWRIVGKVLWWISRSPSTQSIQR
jgi:transcriptional regulator with XRE-family HTH domain